MYKRGTLNTYNDNQTSTRNVLQPIDYIRKAVEEASNSRLFDPSNHSVRRFPVTIELRADGRVIAELSISIDLNNDFSERELHADIQMT